ncbi:hypothetical protein TRFO_06948 [Tritrichomonas foetus]|uniref:Uncharacterized protein n=1 Tax=Tritrichomonas foetus TaxID=1144522 RepID=A0A1J4K057_9EUKA|nr:hypothetical protein TRFO_06948 [Tritrichomonas foetus]|eukprot:OHT02893.1 hypothetical protein TRFO_06948 [Tritrichomonas foetus]
MRRVTIVPSQSITNDSPNNNPPLQTSSNMVTKQKNAETENIKKMIEQENHEYQQILAQLKKENDDLDDELDFIKNDFYEKRSTLQKILRSQQENIIALKKTPTNLNNSMSTQEIQYKNLESEINQLNITANTIQKTIDHLEGEIQESYQMISLIPSNNSEILEIAKRQINRTIQSEIFQAQDNLEDATYYLDEIKEELSLSESLIKDITKENEDFTSRISESQKKFEKLQQEKKLLVKKLSDARGLISLSNLKTTLKSNLIQTKKELAQIEKDYKIKFAEIDNNYMTLSKEFNDRKIIIETLNNKIRDITLNALKEKEECRKKINQVKQRNLEEINDIQQRFQKMCAQALQNQRKTILKSLYPTDQ